jgi:hypothetical protein
MMKLIFAALIITIAVPALTFAQIETKQADNDERIFRKLERELFDAFEGKPDLETLERFFAEDYFSINADGKTANKQQSLEAVRSGYLQVDKITSDEFRLCRYGDTAVITGSSAYFKDGKKIGEVRHTQIWVKRKGQWQLAAWQGTPFSRP